MRNFLEPNPLLEMQFRIPFDRIQAAHIEPAVRRRLEEARAQIESIAAAAGPRNFENTLMRLDLLGEGLDYAMSVARVLEFLATTAEIRSAYNAVQPEVSAFLAGIPLHAGLWEAVRQVWQSDEAQALEGARKRFLTKTVDSFRRHGATLDEAGKTRLKEIDVELSGLTTKFGENVLDATNAFELLLTDESKLSGLPPSAIEAARAGAEQKGQEGWRFTLQSPSYVPLMTYLDDGSIREQVYRAYNARAAAGEYDNRPLIARILELRREKARLLGYRDFADFALEDRMARDGERAQAFLEDLRQKTEKQFRKEAEELLAFRRSLEGEDAPELQPWDVSYYAEKLRKARYDFDEESLRPYFPLEQVVQGMFTLFGRLFGIRIVERENVPRWDPQVRYFEIYEESAPEGAPCIGAFYADFHPRENKRGGGWMDSIITGGPAPDGFRPHLALIAANLTPPLGGRPALLTHSEVETIFQEFGHLLHHCLSKSEIRSMARTNVVWDFVELPSQILENWCWEREALDLIARHWETGEPIPEELYQKMKRARNFRSASAQMRQLGFGFVDLALHRDYQPQLHGDVVAYSREIFQRFSPAPLAEDHAMIASFTHLFASPVGYGAGYYSYKWAEVLDADAFTRFQKEGLFNPEVGREFRQKILEPGDTRDPAELYRSFMGRDPDPNALLQRSGLLDFSTIT